MFLEFFSVADQGMLLARRCQTTALSLRIGVRFSKRNAPVEMTMIYRDDSDGLAGLGGYQWGVVAGDCDHLRGVGQSAVEGVGEHDWKFSREKIDVELEIAARVEAMDHQSSAVAIRGIQQIERDGPQGGAIKNLSQSRFDPMERTFS